MSRSYYSDAYLLHAQQNRLRVDRMRLIESQNISVDELNKDKSNTSKEDQEV